MSHDSTTSDDTGQEASNGASVSAVASQIVESSKTVADSVASGVQATATQAAMGAAATAATAAEGAKGVAAEAAATAAKAAESAQATAGQAAAGAQATVETGSDSVKTSADTFVDELTRLGAQLTTSAKGALENPHVKEAQASVTSALSGLALSIEEQVKKLAEREDVKRTVQQVETGADSAIEAIATNKTVQDVAAGIMKGLGSAASQLTTWLNQQGSAGAQSGGGFGGPETGGKADDAPDVQEIKVEKQE